MPRKEFEAFTRLDASDVNTYLMDQSVMSFAGTAARGSAIATPVEGMYTHLTDSPPRLEFWDGSSWGSPFGSTLLASQSFTTATSVTIDNVFKTAFIAYHIVVNTTAHATATELTMTLRVGGVDAASNYTNQLIQADDTSVTGVRNASQTAARIGRLDTVGGMASAIIGNVALAQRTYGLASSFDSALIMHQRGFVHTTATAYDGFKLEFTSGTGHVLVYGLRS
jgi:hypothetical protein